ncbi:MAG: HD domain-containing protein [Actinomycetota bacterium]|nr:HD domain-containing protein [Actinomycetota bacterium]
MSGAEALCKTPAEVRSLTALRAASGEVDGVMERHCMRCFELCQRIASRKGVVLDLEVMLCAAILHDIGLYNSVSDGGVYTEEGAALARKIGLESGWDHARADLCAEACARHHSLTSKWESGAEVEALRLADRIEVSGGLSRAGLSRSEVEEVFAMYPRAGFYGGLAQLVGPTLRHRPWTMPRIFKP